jgi:hygromycin-B 4-O-kinase
VTGRKPAVSQETVAALLAELFGDPPPAVAPLEEGMGSRAFSFEAGGAAFVLRIAASSRGFEKDRWAAETAGRHVPVPEVVTLGELDGERAYCVTRRLPGTTLEALPRDEAAGVTGAVHEAWLALGRTNVSAIDGFGDFDPDGHAPARSWRDVLRTTLESTEPDDDRLVIDTYAELVERCPEERSLVHRDFGSNNVLARGHDVTGVLDWERALVGDPLYDVANMRFWTTYLPCMELQASHFDRELGGLPGYEDRVSCYALRIGIEETRETRRDGDEALLRWAAGRCRELATGYPE